jgi:alpha-beta hydrolase superfamily lysophospholipase
MDWDSDHGFSTVKLELKDDYEGRAEATLVYRKSKKPSSKAILYVHGFVDYFYQLDLADWANNIGFNFYAIDLRKYGRSMLPHQKPNHIRNIEEYYEELDLAVDIIRGKDRNNFLALMGHSTGGLITPLYTHDRAKEKNINALILNSPFFEFNAPDFLLKTAIPLFASIGKSFPEVKSPLKLEEGYPKSLHKEFYGEWHFDFKMKPVEGFKIHFGWIRAIHQAHKRLQKGLKVDCPVLLLHSSASTKPGKYNDDMQTADAVLNVEHMKKYGPGLGADVQMVEIPEGKHDLVLSGEEARKLTYNKMKTFLDSLTTKNKPKKKNIKPRQ